MKLPESIGVLRNRNFRLYWIGQAVSLTGTWGQYMAQLWVVARLSTSAGVLGLLNVVGSLPMMGLAMQGGALADRLEKRRILIVTQVIMMLLAFVFAGLVFSGRIALWHIFTLAFLLGIATAFDLPAAQALPAELVERAEIPKAVALMQSIFHGSRFLGPAVAGVLVSRFGEGSAFLGNGVSFLAVIASLVMIRLVAKPAARGASRRGAIAEGFRYVRSEPTLRALILLTALTTSLVFPFIIVLLVFYVKHVLMANAQGMGIVMSVSGLGSLTGALVLLSGGPETRRKWILGGVLGSAAALVALSFTHTLSVAVAIVALLSFSISSLMGRITQMIQEIVPGVMRGRVMGTYAMSFMGVMPYAALLLSFVTDRIGFQSTVRISSGLYVTLALVLLYNAHAALAHRASPAAAPSAQAEAPAEAQARGA